MFIHKNELMYAKKEQTIQIPSNTLVYRDRKFIDFFMKFFIS